MTDLTSIYAKYTAGSTGFATDPALLAAMERMRAVPGMGAFISQDDRLKALALAARSDMPGGAAVDWQPIATAPKDGCDLIWLAWAIEDEDQPFLGLWDADAGAWVDHQGTQYLDEVIEDGANEDEPSLYFAPTHWRRVDCPTAPPIAEVNATVETAEGE